MPLNPRIVTLTCFACGRAEAPTALRTTCPACGMPLRVDYDLASIRLSPGDLAGRAPSLWRYREVLPVTEGDEVSLVEGWTPLLAIAPTNCGSTLWYPGWVWSIAPRP